MAYLPNLFLVFYRLKVADRRHLEFYAEVLSTGFYGVQESAHLRELHH